MKLLTKEWLEDVYLTRKLSTWAIEKKSGISRSRVFTALKRFGIPTRSLAQSHIRYVRTDFSGDLFEKAYLIGFAIGDLRVRKHNGPRSSTISIGCGSTKSAQIRLVRELFSKYGRVWQGLPDRRGAVNIEAFVNESFCFLLRAQREYLWCRAHEGHFFSFLAGFTDAEGSWFISDGKACVAWGNYDKDILAFIRKELIAFGINVPNIYCDSLRGYVGTHGYARNKDYCHLSCAKKDDVKKLIEKLGPYMRHADKKRNVARVRKNLIMRGVAI